MTYFCIVLFIIAAYLLGSIPSAVWIGKKYYGIDIREYGSKNAGATNTLRVLGKRAALPVFALDVFKGFVAVTLMGLMKYNPAIDENTLVILKISAVVAAVLGHIFPIFAGFRGGKGVATSAGVFAALLPVSTAIAFASFVVCVALWGRISIGSICACIVLPIASFFIGKHPLSVNLMVTAVALLVIYKHVPNIKRLLAQKELKFEDGAKKRKENEHK